MTGNASTKTAAPASQVGKAAARQAIRNAGSVTGLLEKKKSKAPAAPAPAKASVPVVACGCGCGETANPGRLYRPGHDARHAGQVGRALVAKAPGAEEAAASLPTALEAKARAFAANAAKKEAAKEARAQVRADAKAALEAALAAL